MSLEDVAATVRAGCRPTAAGLAGHAEAVRRHAYRVTDADVAALRERFSDDEILEATLLAALEAAEARRNAALAALR